MAVLLLPKTCAPALNVAAALTVRLLLPLLPSTALPFAVSKPATVRLVPYVTPALKTAAALTVNVLLLLVPSVLLPLAVRAPATLRVVAAVMAALNCAAALTVSELVLPVPSTVLPLAVRVLLALERVRDAVKVARPELSTMRRSVTVAPAVVLVVLKIRLPPFCWLAAVSCSAHHTDFCETPAYGCLKA